MINKIFKCTSVRLKDYLKGLGFKYIWIDVDKNNITFWLFEQTEEFNKALNKWNENK